MMIRNTLFQANRHLRLLSYDVYRFLALQSVLERTGNATALGVVLAEFSSQEHVARVPFRGSW